MNVIKRNGREVEFDKSKIVDAILKASTEVESQNRTGVVPAIMASAMATELSNKFKKNGHAIGVEDIQDEIEMMLMERGYPHVAKQYIRYRYERQLQRNGNTTDGTIMSIVDGVNETVVQENSNKNPIIASTQRDYIAGEVSKDLTARYLLPKEIVKAHEDGILHFHDADYFLEHIFNCCLVNMDDMLQNGTVINDKLIEKPHRFTTACNVATQIMAAVASNQYGGQSTSCTALAKFIDVSRQSIKCQLLEELEGIDVSEERFNKILDKRVREEVKNGVQIIQYQINTLMTTNGQTPFVTLFMYLNEAENQQTKDDLAMLIEEIFLQRIQGVKNEKGVWITPAFPKLIYVLEDDNIYEGSKYYNLTKLAAKCTAKRMVPDYISEKIMLRDKVDDNGEGHCYTCMGCRSFLTPYIDVAGKPKYYGRFNQGVVTISLADVGLSANKDMKKFWDIFDERLEMCHQALQIRHKRLRGTSTNVSPIHWQHGALARLSKDDTIDSLLFGGYSTISLGYAGLYECVKAMTGKSHTDQEGKQFALEIMQYMNNKCTQWKTEENIAYSLYGTPIESTTYKFAKCLKKRFGIIKGITDKNYITNSYHIHVTEEIDAFSKLSFESEFQKLSPGGAISYVEVPNLTHNLEAVMSVMQYIYENIMYAELNTKCDYCQVCGWDGEIEITEDDNKKLIWKCPNCGNTNRNKMNIVRRTCGYLGANDFNQGRTQEIKERVLHL